MIQFNTFSASSVPTAEEFKKATESKGGKVFRPGRYTLTIHSAALDGTNPDDESWTSVKLMLVGENKSINTWVNVPTSSISCKVPEGSNRNPFGPFLQLQAFVKSLGGDLEPTPESLNEVLPGLFSDLDVLKGLEVTVDIGYFKDHVAYDESAKMYFLANKKGERLNDDLFEDRATAEMEAASAGIAVQKYPRILGFVAKELGA